MKNELSLREVYILSVSSSDYRDFKSMIDEIFNDTPVTAVDDSNYKLIKQK